MFRNVSDARKKLFELSKKYNVANKPKSEERLSSSNESLVAVSVTDFTNSNSSLSDVNLNQNKSVTVNSNGTSKDPCEINSRPASSRSLKAITPKGLSLEENLVVNHVDSKNNISKSENVPVVSLVSVPSRKLNYLTNKESDNNSASDTDISIKSHKILSNNQSEIEEIFSNETSSVINDPFANVHLVSDDILDNIEDCTDSNSSIKEEIHTGRLSAVQSIKSLQLSSPLEPPKLDSDYYYYYSSDFESSDEEIISQPVSHKSEGDFKNNYSNKNSITYIEESDSSNLKNLNLIHVKDQSIEKNLSFSDISQDEMLSFSSESKTDKSTKTLKSYSEKISTEESNFKDSIEKHIDRGCDNSIESDSDFKNKTEYDKVSSVKLSVAVKETSSEKNDVSQLYSEEKKSIDDRNIERSGLREIVNISRKKGTPKLSKSIQYKSIGIQTAYCREFDFQKIVQNEGEMKNNVKMLREKRYIDISVKSTGKRPTVKSSKLGLYDKHSSYFNQNTSCNPYLFCPKVQGR